MNADLYRRYRLTTLRGTKHGNAKRFGESIRTPSGRRCGGLATLTTLGAYDVPIPGSGSTSDYTRNPLLRNKSSTDLGSSAIRRDDWVWRKAYPDKTELQTDSSTMPVLYHISWDEEIGNEAQACLTVRLPFVSRLIIANESLCSMRRGSI